MADPLLTAIAAAVASKAVAAAAAGGRSALAALYRLVKERFAKDEKASEALEQAEASPEDPKRLEALGAALRQAADQDPEFAGQLRELWGQARTELRAESGGVINEVTGSVGGHVVQARDIQGGIAFGEAPRQPS